MSRIFQRRSSFSGLASGDLITSSVANLAELSDLPITDAMDGVLILVRDIDAVYRYAPFSSRAVDGSATVAANGDSGRWHIISGGGGIGSQGPQGPQGSQGSQGPQGIEGVQGSSGPQGSSGSQGAAGAQGSIGFQGPQGFQGVSGAQGIQGNVGAQGSQGATGTQGAQGIAGPQGIEGSQGPQGLQGDYGFQGFQGLQGDLGPQGDMGPQGFQGDQGPQGFQGFDGAQGITGADGPQGFQGDQGPQGFQGDIGFQGEVGPQGFQGDMGFQGYEGAQGFQGDIGPQGFQGDQGPQGPQGWEGPQGFQGDIGPQGSDGPQGFQGYQGDIGPQGPQGDMGYSGPTGEQGPAGPLPFYFMGPYNNGMTYSPEQAVEYNGSTWVMHTYIGAAGYAPEPTHWYLFASKGDVGPQGVAGPQGNVGPQGYQGVTGPQGSTGPQGNTGAQGATGSTGAGGALGYYGSFYDTTDQLAAAINTPYAMQLGITSEANGVSIVSGSRVRFGYAGTYNIQFSAQLHNNGGGGSGTVDIWLRKNGVDIADSDTQVSVLANNPYVVAAWNFVLTVNATDYIELMWATDSTAIRLESIAASPGVHPAVPSIIVTAQQVMYTQLGPQGAQGLQGSQGPQGFQGTQGTTGPQGVTGVQGATGTQGATGAQGTQGSTGSQGSTGPQGIRGSHAYRNKIINGAMVFDQRNEGTSILAINDGTTVSTAAFPVDRWVAINGTLQNVSVGRSTDVPTGYGFTNSLSYVVTGANVTSAGLLAGLEHRVEGTLCSDLWWGYAQAKTVTLSFWVKSSVTGIYCISLRNNGNTRAYISEYTISSANTWEQKTITVPGSTLGTSTWLTSTSVGLRLGFSLGDGTTYQGTADTWLTTSKRCTANQTSFITSYAGSNQTFLLTGVQLEIGDTATDFEFRSRTEEIALCRRYCQKSYADGTAPGNSTESNIICGLSPSSFASTQCTADANLCVDMRATPTAVFYDRNTGASGSVSVDLTAVAISSFTPNLSTRKIRMVKTTNFTSGQYVQYHYLATAEI